MHRTTIKDGHYMLCLTVQRSLYITNFQCKRKLHILILTAYKLVKLLSIPGKNKIIFPLATLSISVCSQSSLVFELQSRKLPQT